MGKLGIVIDALHSGGVEKIAINQAVSVHEIGHPVALVVLRRTNPEKYPYQPLLDKTEVIYLDDRLAKWLRFSFKFPFFSFFSLYHLTYPILLPWVIKKHEYNCLVSHGTYTSLTSLAIKIFRGVPYLISLWDPVVYILKRSYPSGPIHQLKFLILPLAALVDRVLLKNAKVVLVAGHAHVPYIQNLGVKSIGNLYPGVNVNKTLDKNKGDYLLAVTAWKEGKNQDFLLEILEKIPNLQVVMAGSWYPHAFQEEYRSKVKKMGLLDRIRITGALPEEKLRELYSQANLFLQVSDDRGFGMPALEAASCGCPFIIPLNQGVGELFEDGKEGFIVDINNKIEILEKIKLLTKDRRLAVQMGTNGWEKVKNHYSWKNHAQKLIEVVQQNVA